MAQIVRAKVVMAKLLTGEQEASFQRDGYVFPLRIMSEKDAGKYYKSFLSVEDECGGTLAGPVR